MEKKEIKKKRKEYKHFSKKRFSKRKKRKGARDYYDRIVEQKSFYGVLIVIGMVGFCIFLLFTIDYQVQYFEYLETDTSDKLNEYIYNEYHYPTEHLEGVDPEIVIDESYTIEPSKHYKGWESFYNDTIGNEPDNWTVDEGSATVSEDAVDDHTHDNIAFLKAVPNQYKCIMSRNFSESANYGIIEYWWYFGSNVGDLMLLNSWGRFQWLNESGDIIMQTQQLSWFGITNYNYFGWNNATGTTIAENTWGNDTHEEVPLRQWHNVKIEFRCENAPEFRNLAENSYNLYYRDTSWYNATFINPSDSLDTFRFYINTGQHRIDGIGLDFIDIKEPKEFNNENYTEGEYEETWSEIIKEAEMTCFFSKDFRNIKNFSYSLEFDTNLTLENDLGSYFSIYNFYDDDWEIIQDPIIQDYSINETRYYPSMWYLNDSSYQETSINLKIYTNNLHYDYEFNLNFDLYAYFWILIT